MSTKGVTNPVTTEEAPACYNKKLFSQQKLQWYLQTLFPCRL
jgi:hypothetical protein